jgi:glycosyltransferase involved in cell wall biosynthesis
MEPGLVIIPAYNAARSIAEVIKRINRVMMDNHRNYEILVIDDGSVDRTEQIALSQGAQIIRHTTNQGKGSALKSGFTYAFSHSFEFAVTIDADLQHDPSSLLPMIEYFQKGRYDLVIGSRKFDPKKMSLGRILSNSITSALIGLRAHQHIPDSQSGYRILRISAIKDITLKTARYETESELLLRLCKKARKIGFYPIDTIYQGETSHIRHLQDTLRFIRMYFATLKD